MTDSLPAYRGGTISHSPPPLPPLALVVAKHTPAYFRMRQAGFSFDTPYFYPSRKEIEGSFTCVCGRQERYVWPVRSVRHRVLDVAQFIEEEGAVSAKHLLGDGYSKEEIKKIRAAYV